MAKNETNSGLFVALNYFSHLTLCLSKKMTSCFKSFNIFEKASFHSLAVTDYHYRGVRLTFHRRKIETYHLVLFVNSKFSVVNHMFMASFYCLFLLPLFIAK